MKKILVLLLLPLIPFWRCNAASVCTALTQQGQSFYSKYENIFIDKHSPAKPAVINIRKKKTKGVESHNILLLNEQSFLKYPLKDEIFSFKNAHEAFFLYSNAWRAPPAFS
jgi:hypothetical protein